MNIRKIQVVGWTVLYLINVLYLLPEEDTAKAFVYPLVSIFFYLVIIYGNVLWLIPSFYERRRYGIYAVALLLFFVGVVSMRMWINHEIFFKGFGETMYDYSARQVQYVSFSTFLILTVSVLFHLTIRYFSLVKTQEALRAQHFHSELNLLKAQVQPHFLFNTLNNIYYEAYRESPRAAGLIEKLSQMMRYFVEESTKEKVSLATEITFLQNYIELEKIRMRHPLGIVFKTPPETSLLVPPMLLIPLVENLFKHGIDKRRPHHEVLLLLELNSDRLMFSVINPCRTEETPSPGGHGLKNLRLRLRLLYGEAFTLKAEPEGDNFVSILTIPVS